MKPIANGSLDRRVSIQNRSTSTDAYGSRGEAYTTVGTVWANYKPQAMQGTALNEMSDQPQFIEKATFTFRTPKSFNVTGTSRLVYKNANWKIIGMAEAGIREEYLMINAVKTDSDILD